MVVQCHLFFNRLRLDTSESKTWTLTKHMNEVSIHVSYIFGNKQNLIYRYIREDITEDRGTWIQERPTVGPNRPERQN